MDGEVIAFPSAGPVVEPFDFDTWYQAEALPLIAEMTALEHEWEVDEFWVKARSIKDQINLWPIPTKESQP